MKHSGESRGGSAVYYDQFFGPLFFEPFAIEVARRIDPANVSVALEIAAGTGRVTRHLRQSLPASARLIASDISADMLAVAKEKLANQAIEWQTIDAGQLPFPDNSIDLVVCCFGYMFVPDRAKAFAEAWRVLKPGSMFLLTTWDKLEQNAASSLTLSIVKEYLSKPLPVSYGVATSLHDETIIAQLLDNAGFSSKKVEKITKSAVSASATAAAEGLVEGGIFYADIQQQHPEAVVEIKIRVAKELAARFGEAPMISPVSAVIAQAWK